MRNWKRWGGLIFAMFVSVAVLGVSIYFWDWLSGGSKYKNGGTARNVALSIGGVWAIYAVFLAAIRVKIMQQQQVSESLARAAEQLSSGVMAVRILAILSLGSIALEVNQQTRRDVIKVLCVCIRKKCSIHNQKRGNKEFPEDMEQVLYVLSNIQRKKHEYAILDLSGVDLSGVDLSDVNLSDADFINAILSNAILSNANLSGADLSGADLSGATLSRTDLSGATLSGVIGLDTAKNLESVENPPQEILDEIARHKQD